MARKLMIWTVKDVKESIEEMTSAKMKFDAIIFIEGPRGMGKSTLAYKILNGLDVELPFVPKRDIVFTREDTLRHLSTKINGCIFSDELINVAYKRDFYNEDQKDLLKALDMYRDSRNVFIGCIPKFIDLDNKIQKLCKIRITVVRRGLALIHLQNRTVFSNDPWDVKNNQKIESKWALRGQTNPKYGQLTTVKGLLHFGDLTDKQREEYEAIKQEKRSHVFGKYNDIALLNNPETVFMTNLMTKLKEGKLNPDTFELLCTVNDKKPESIRIKINKMLKDANDPKTWRDYCQSDKVKQRKDRLGFTIKDEPIKPLSVEKDVAEEPEAIEELEEPISAHDTPLRPKIEESEEDVFGFTQ